MKIGIVRGCTLNSVEIQEFYGLKDAVAVGSTSLKVDYETGAKQQIDMPYITADTANWNSFTQEGLHYILSQNFDVIDVVEQYLQFTLQLCQEHSNVFVEEWENIPFHPQWAAHRGRFANEKLGTLGYEGVSLVKRLAKGFIARTNMIKSALTIEGVDPDRIRVVYPSIDVERFKPLSVDRSDDTLTILFSGRIDYYKGILDLIHATKLLSLDKEVPPFKVVFAEKDDSGKVPWGDLAKGLDIFHLFDFLGRVPYQQMATTYNKADIVVQASIPCPNNWIEQFGMSIVEAMACGKPIVTTYGGGPQEIMTISGLPTGYLVPPTSYDLLYEALKKLLVNKKWRQNLGDNARTVVLNNFNNQLTASQLEKVYGRE